jgi:hypothetical protein
MKPLNEPLGPLFNFHAVKLVARISTLVLPGPNKPQTEGNEGNEACGPSNRPSCFLPRLTKWADCG